MELYFESKTDSDYKIIIDHLSQKYGTPSLQALINDVSSWEGKYLLITSTHEDIGQIVVV